jgi:hypothetical protein
VADFGVRGVENFSSANMELDGARFEVFTAMMIQVAVFTLKIESKWCLEILVFYHITTRYHNPDDRNLRT